MAAGIAHQINNPLTTIIAEAQMLLRNLPADHPERESADAIQQAGWRLQEAVQRLTEFSRPATATLEEISINQAVQSAVNLVGAHIEATGVRLVCNLAQNLPPVRGNAHQMVDLWVNMLLLARDATDDGLGHTIQVRSDSDSSGSIVVEVIDDGSPIPAEQLDAIFEPNFIGPSCQRGTGMELSICREIVRQHGGQITAESTAGRDTIFRVVLPSLVQASHPVPGDTVDEFSRS
jgi:two-component system NtrC family sensor kinase